MIILFNDMKKCEYVLISVGGRSGWPAAGPSKHDRNADMILSETMDVKLCTIIMHIRLLLFLPRSVTFTILQGHNIVKQFH